MKIRLALSTLLITVATTAWLSTTYAEDGQEPQDSREEYVCEAECKAQRQQCLDTCAEYPNPLECDRECNNQSQECMDSCH